MVVGDRVKMDINPDGTAYITEIEDRKNYIVRKASNLSKHSHILAANIDLALLCITVRFPETTTVFIDRFLVTAEAYSVPVYLVFNKIDIYDSEDKEYVDGLIHLYSTIGYTCIKTSVLTGEGMDEVRELVCGKVTLLAGHSGVGKSSLLNALFPTYHLETGELSEKIQRGKHTTRHAELYGDWDRGLIADTPGFYKLESPFVEPRKLAETFPEMREALGKCRFNSCIHDKEPDCAIKALLSTGSLSLGRYETYLQLLHEMQERERGQYQ